MNNIFENAKFGDKYIDSKGRIGLFITSLRGNTAACVLFKDDERGSWQGIHRFYYNSGEPFGTDKDNYLKKLDKSPNSIYKTTCPKCNKEIEYQSSDITHQSFEEPWSGYTEESEWITCPHCKKDIRV